MKVPYSINKEVKILHESHTDPKYGFYYNQRPIKELFQIGLINLDKPPRPSSHEVSAWVKKILKLTKVGHGGTLDPQVTGVLPILLEKATKITELIQESPKEYIGIMELHQDTTETKIQHIFSLFKGTIYQKPPVKSAVKRRLRTRKIYDLELLELEGRYVLFRVKCESGTYVRKLCYDIGLVLGTGAHMRELRRTKSGIFHENNSITLQQLYDAAYYYFEENNSEYLKKIIIPIEFALKDYPWIFIRDNAVNAITYGAALTAPGIVALTKDIKPNKWVVIGTLKGEAVALAIAHYKSQEIETMKKGIVAQPKHVIMSRDIYPKTW